MDVSELSEFTISEVVELLSEVFVSPEEHATNDAIMAMAKKVEINFFIYSQLLKNS